MLNRPATYLLALLCLSGCMGTKPPAMRADATSAPTPKASDLEPAEKMLFAEVDEFVGLGNEALKDSLWFQAAEDFGRGLVCLSTMASQDSLSPSVNSYIGFYRDSVMKLMVRAVGMTSKSEPVPWTEEFDEEMQDVSDSTVHVMDSITHHIDSKIYDLPLTSPLNERILQAMAVFMGPGRGYFTKWLTRKSRYEALVIPRLEARGMPKDLIYLAMVESGFNPKAWSKAAAAGMWQFISGTGRRYGLKDDWWYDPRRDPVLATEAALDYLEDLHGEFGDWHQAMAAYNCGEGRVRRFRGANPAMSFWDMPLPQETRFYVPKILAAMIIGHNPERYGFNIESPEPPLAFDTATVTHCLSIAAIAKAAGTKEEEIITLNPALRRWCTPPNRPSHVVYLPPGSRDAFMKSYEEMDKSRLVNWYHHIVDRGESLGSIASRYRVSTAAIMATNKMKGSKVRPGQRLLIPLAPENAGRWKEQDPDEDQPKTAKYAGGSYKVRPGDNLFDIARKFNTTVSKLLAANGLRPGAVIRPGQRLKLSGGKGKGKRGGVSSDERDFRVEPPLPDAEAGTARAEAPARAEEGSDGGEGAEHEQPAPAPSGKAKVHVVSSGENLFQIALKHGVSMDELVRWNRLKSTGILAG
ncbi:MAG TPA: LysM peptidoglycan-binding domain-containing protein, partial [Fibrobacteria bacterium]|nr:LysM peptidoglycan-binding domain-containing protein [Fibrobacteria bacterium]